MVERFTHLRREDWQIRLVEFLKDSMQLGADLEVNWDSEGTTCFGWVGMGVEEMTGYNPHTQFEGRYNGVLSACKLIRELGYTSFDNLIADMFQEVPVGRAQFGDVGLVRFNRWDVHDDEATFAEEMMPHGIVLIEPPFYYGVGESGLVKGDLYRDVHRAFAVGREI